MNIYPIEPTRHFLCVQNVYGNQSINTEFVFSKQSLSFDLISDRVIDCILQ